MSAEPDGASKLLQRIYPSEGYLLIKHSQVWLDAVHFNAES